MPLSLSHFLSLASIAFSAISFCLPTQAQIAGDGTLGTQVNSTLTTPCTGICLITQGSARGVNLFHSFRQFSLPNPADGAGFIISPAIRNVIVRVTGQGSEFISNINGTIATLTPANIFLLNPNGIVFGPGATLLNSGTFLATTASELRFQDGTVFRTNNPAPLLTISVPAGLQFNGTPGNIQLQGSRLSAGSTDSFGDFALVGGDVVLDNAKVMTPGHRLALVGVGENGAVGLQLNGDRLSLSLANGTPRHDITLINGSSIDARASNGGGEVVAIGHNITLGGGSSILTGISFGTDNAATNQAGNITIDAANNLQLTQTSFINNLIDPNALGQGGNISVTAADIQARDGSTIAAFTSGNGNAGSVQLRANTIVLDGVSPDGLATGIGSQVAPTGSGHGGDVTIEAGALTITNGATVSASTFGNGDAGNVKVTANTIALDGTTPNGQFVSGISSEVASTGSGRGGDVIVETGSLTATNRATVSASAFGKGDAGDVTVEASSLTLLNGAAVFASTFGTGNAGNVRVKANTIALDGVVPNSQFATGIFSQVSSRGKGQGGDVTVEAGSLIITNGATISAGTLGNGDAGNVRVTANRIALDGTAPNDLFVSGISSQVGPTGSGHGGDVTVEADSLIVTNGAVVSAATFGNGSAGNVRVTANTIALDGTAPSKQFASGIFSQVSATGSGRGGDITIKANSLTLTNGAAVSTSAFGSGSAGNLDITARNVWLDRSFITAAALSGDGANINFKIGNLLLMRHNSQISTSAGLAGTGGNGGNITINAPRGFLVTAPNENNDITANAFNGSGGRVNINAQGIYWFTPRSRTELTQLLGTSDPTQLDSSRLPTNDITAISQGNPNLSGTVTLDTPDIDPNRGLVELPANLSDSANLIAQRCPVNHQQGNNSFYITGRGGLPLRPGDEPLSEYTTGDIRVAIESSQNGAFRRSSSPASTAASPLIEADNWIVDKDGSVMLVASRAMFENYSVWQGLPTCPPLAK